MLPEDVSVTNFLTYLIKLRMSYITYGWMAKPILIYRAISVSKIWGFGARQTLDNTISISPLRESDCMVHHVFIDDYRTLLFRECCDLDFEDVCKYVGELDVNEEAFFQQDCTNRHSANRRHFSERGYYVAPPFARSHISWRFPLWILEG